jgi:hypothetical protein
MRRGRKPAPPVAGGIPREVYELAKEKLEQDYLGFVAGTATEDPKLFAARHEAAQAALDHLAQLWTLAGAAPAGEPAEPSTEDLLEVARANIANENKT